jgi:hypothetical protein
MAISNPWIKSKSQKNARYPENGIE